MVGGVETAKREGFRLCGARPAVTAGGGADKLGAQWCM
jgi:hypothetical protein